MDLEVTVPEDYFGSVMGDLTSRRGKVGGTTIRNKMQVIRATVPLAQMFGYATELRSITQGRAIFTMQFLHYDTVPKMISEKLLEKFIGKPVV